MKTMTVALTLALVALPGSLTRAAAQRGTIDEAKAMLQKAVAHYQEVGRKPALADFTARKPPFADRDLYVFCIGPNRVISAHGATAPLVGVSVDTLKDAEGKLLGKAILEVASAPGGDSIRYRWINPLSGKIEPKISFVRKVGDEVCGVGAYEPE